MKCTKKLLALVLAMMMAFTMMIIPAAAAPTDESSDVQPSILDDIALNNDVLGNQAQFANTAIRLSSDGIQDTDDFIGREDLSNALFSQNAAELTYYGELSEAGLTKSYVFEVDHSSFPEILICAYPSGSVDDFKITIFRESDQKSWSARTENEIDEGTVLIPKQFFRFSNSDGITETYTITITALTSNTYYAFTIGTPDAFENDFGGPYTFATVPKNTPDEEKGARCMTYFMKGHQALLNTGEWFHYVADGETYITASMLNWNGLAFDVYELEAGELKLVYETSSTDRLIMQESSTLYQGFVQKRLDLERGKDYFICFYSTTYRQVESIWDTYNIWIGYPYFLSDTSGYKSATYSIPANTTRTFTFNVSGVPKSMRADPSTYFQATGNGKYMDTRVSSCTITAPNGYSFTAQFGYKSGLPYPVIFNYLNNPSNIPINGKWTVKVTTSAAIPDWRFVIYGGTSIVGNDGN